MLAKGWRFSEWCVWRGYDSEQIEHWNEPIASKLKFPVVAHKTKTKPGKHIAQEGAAAGVRPDEAEGDGGAQRR